MIRLIVYPSVYNDILLAIVNEPPAIRPTMRALLKSEQSCLYGKLAEIIKISDVLELKINEEDLKSTRIDSITNWDHYLIIKNEAGILIGKYYQFVNERSLDAQNLIGRICDIAGFNDKQIVLRLIDDEGL